MRKTQCYVREKKEYLSKAVTQTNCWKLSATEPFTVILLVKTFSKPSKTVCFNVVFANDWWRLNPVWSVTVGGNLKQNIN